MLRSERGKSPRSHPWNTETGLPVSASSASRCAGSTTGNCRVEGQALGHVDDDALRRHRAAEHRARLRRDFALQREPGADVLQAAGATALVIGEREPQDLLVKDPMPRVLDEARSREYARG